MRQPNFFSSTSSSLQFRCKNYPTLKLIEGEGCSSIKRWRKCVLLLEICKTSPVRSFVRRWWWWCSNCISRHCFFSKLNLGSFLSCPQCDQIEKLFLQFLAICYNENMPNGRNKFPKFGQILNEPSKNYQRL